MKNLIGISTGSINTWDEKIDNVISIFREIGVEAIEVLFGTLSELDQEFSEENIEYLKGLKYVAIHAPFYDNDRNDLYYEDNDKTKEIIEKCQKFYKLFGAKAIVFHPNLIRDWDILQNIDMNLCFENLPKKRNISIENLKEVFIKLPHSTFVLDTAHALYYDIDMVNALLSEFKDKMQHVHFSDRRYSEFKKKMGSHQQLLFCKDIEKFNKLKELSCPIILELNIKDKIGDLNNIKLEIAHVDKFFNKK